MDKENKTLEGLLREQSTVAKSGEKITPQLLVKVRHKHLVGVHVSVELLDAKTFSDTLNFTVVDNKLIPHFVVQDGNGMNFGEATNQMQLMDYVRRPGHDKDSYIKIQAPDKDSRTTKPYLCVVNERLNRTVPYILSYDDIFAEDWIVVSSANGSDEKPKSK